MSRNSEPDPMHSAPRTALLRRLSASTLLALVLAGAACSPDEFPDASAILFGRVTAEEGGAPIAGARVTATFHRSLCSTAPTDETSGVTDATGEYRVLLEIRARIIGCVRLHVTAPGHQSLTVTRTDVQFEERAPQSFETNMSLRRQ